MLEKIITYDKQLLVYLNNLGSTKYDWFWILVTDQKNWLPVFILFFYLMYKNLGKEKFLLAVFAIAFIILFADQTSYHFKNYFQRLRPCNNLDIKNSLRFVIEARGFSFYSGHATNSMGATTFIFLVLRKYYKHAYLLFLFPLLFAYSRIYLGLHFPIDILTGYAFGILYANIFYRLYLYVQNKFIKTKNPE
jgi:undecaprenyl-diphosphatase